ncbi:MAG: hypothetical protein OER90_05410 [Gemmatimonadota bacterium]|nr:hypothetical protein [Gemmatimonadota bacterium]
MRCTLPICLCALAVALPSPGWSQESPPDTGDTKVVPACFVGGGTHDVFGTIEQGRALREYPEGCGVVGVIWKVKVLPDRYSELYWDKPEEILLRVHREPSGISWERWTGVTRDAVLVEDFSDGFDFESYESGSGNPPLTDNMDRAIHGKRD